MHASLRAESDNADAVAAANVVNARMGKALARARAASGVEASTSGYSSFQVTDKSQVTRWRVAQTLKLESSDFAALSALVSQLQAEGGLVVDGTQFSISEASRKKAEDSLTQQAIKSWQARASDAARGLGFDGWRVGNVTIQTGDFVRPQPMFRQSVMAAGAPPVAMEAGNSDVTVTVTGDAVLETPRPR
ncbi:MAG TPA: SIMPL domain-containing protein [Casimicrobiaceae bacterium]|nr:SIMPL domain-containing protein [Casimicrobiaceae bacterium]